MSELKYKGFYMPESEQLQRKFDDTSLKDLPLTMAYVPFQDFDKVYCEADALMYGTLFPELNKPFYGKFTGERK